MTAVDKSKRGVSEFVLRACVSVGKHARQIEKWKDSVCVSVFACVCGVILYDPGIFFFFLWLDCLAFP